MSLTKIANDLALMGSGPRAGIGEIFLPELQKGSSIMPGKVNPVIPEVALQVAAQVIGNDAAITHRRAPGQLRAQRAGAADRAQPARVDPPAGHAARAFADKCVDGIEANLAGCERSAESTLAAATALNPYIGYDKAAEIVKEAASSGPDAARGRLREGRRRGDLQSGDGPAQDGAGESLELAHPARASAAATCATTRSGSSLTWSRLTRFGSKPACFNTKSLRRSRSKALRLVWNL